MDVTALKEAALMFREMFLTYVSAGFSEDQALRLIAYMMAAYQAGKEDDSGKSE